MENDEIGGFQPAKRQRGINYTEQEKQWLLSLVFQEKHIIECKKTDAVTWREKEASWKRITASFNSISPNQNFRSMDSLKKCYENQKKQVRKDVAKEKASFRRTGGGKGYIMKDESSELTLALMNEKTVFGLENNFDCDVPSDAPLTKVSETYDSDERIITDVEESSEKSGGNNSLEHNWASYKPSDLRKPTHSKLQVVNSAPPHTEKVGAISTSNRNDVTSPNTGFRKWTSRRRPTTSALPSSAITKQYSELSQTKLEIAHLELQNLKNTMTKKEEREETEFLLRKRSLELDVQIKEHILDKMKALPPTDILKYLSCEIVNRK